MDDSDASALVKAALQNDDEAARALVRQLYPLVAKIVHSHRARRTAEEDLCQMIFIKVFQKLSQFSGNVPLEHWVSRIAINTCINQIQAERVRPEIRRADLSEEEVAVVDNLAVVDLGMRDAMNVQIEPDGAGIHHKLGLVGMPKPVILTLLKNSPPLRVAFPPPVF